MCIYCYELSWYDGFSFVSGYREKVMTPEMVQKAAIKSQKRKQQADEKREKDKVCFINILFVDCSLFSLRLLSYSLLAKILLQNLFLSCIYKKITHLVQVLRCHF